MFKAAIIVPIYNVEDYLDQCLRSIELQSAQNIQVVLVNDGSSDSSAQIAAGYAERNTDWQLVHQENEGLSAARNTGLQHIDAEYVAFIDSDDWIEPTLIERAVARAEQCSSDVVIYDALEYNQATDQFKAFYDSSVFHKLYKRFLKSQTAHNALSTPELLTLEPASWKRLYRVDLIKRLKLNFPHGKIFEDMPVHFQVLLEAGRVDLLPGVFYYYRVGRPGKITNQKNRKLLDIFDVLTAAADFLKAGSYSEEVWLAYRVYCMRHISWLGSQVEKSLRRHYFKAARRWYKNLPAIDTRLVFKALDKKLRLFVSYYAIARRKRRLFFKNAADHHEQRLFLLPFRKYAGRRFFIKRLVLKLGGKKLQKAVRAAVFTQSGVKKAFTRQKRRLAELTLLAARPLHDRPVIQNFVIDSHPYAIRSNRGFLSEERTVKQRQNQRWHFEKFNFAPGSAIVDLAPANGLTGIYLARKYPQVKVYTVSADPQLVSNIRYNARLNGVTNLEVLEYMPVAPGKKLAWTGLYDAGLQTSDLAALPSTGLVACDEKLAGLDEICRAEKIDKISLVIGHSQQHDFFAKTAIPFSCEHYLLTVAGSDKILKG